MTQDAASHHSPKRKRDGPSTPKKSSPSKLRANVTALTTTEDDQAAQSPRTQVSNRFEELQLDGTIISKLDLTRKMPQLDEGMEDMDKVKKKPRFAANTEAEIPETPQVPNIDRCADSSISQLGKTDLAALKDLQDLKSSTGKLSKTYPSINRLSDSRSRGKKGMSPLPQRGKSDDSPESKDDAFIDPDRASLTWHDDEITGFDPDDPDDDGEGIDGVGFKPTAAKVEMRQQKKRQQLVDYRSRMNKEARARRFEKRTASLTLSSSGGEDDVDSTRKVRFSEGDSKVMFSI